MLSLYNAALTPLRAAVGLWAAWRRRDPAFAAEWAERTAARLPSVAPGGAWLHGASVGEARIVRQLARGVRTARPALPLIASCTSRTGRAQLPAPPDVDAALFMPLDFRGFAARALDHVRPGAVVLVETELWPNLLHEAWERRVPVVVVNGRLAPERMPRYRRFRRLYAPLLRTLHQVGAQTDDEARRFVEAGVPPSSVCVTGELEYEISRPSIGRDALRVRFGVSASRPVLAAGSTAAGEDGPILDAFLAVRRAHPESFLILAPRHPARAQEVAREASSRGLRLHVLSAGNDQDAGRDDGILVDTVGELAGLYAMAEVSFVGGTLVAVGGHNVLEPAAAGSAVLFGPHTHHVDAPSRALEEAGGALRVADRAELAAAFASLLADPDRARRMAEAGEEVVQRNRGALDRSVRLILSAVDSAGVTEP